MSDHDEGQSPAPPSQLVVPREVTVQITFLVQGMPQELAEQWCMAGTTVAIPQAATIRGVAVSSKAGSVSLVTPAGGSLRRM